MLKAHLRPQALTCPNACHVRSISVFFLFPVRALLAHEGEALEALSNREIEDVSKSHTGVFSTDSEPGRSLLHTVLVSLTQESWI